jgi:hypothetical protein
VSGARKETETMTASYRDTGDVVRALFCIGISPRFFEADGETQQRLFTEIPAAFEDLAGRFGVRVLGTLDDDETMVGPSEGWPWTAYILAEAPDHKAVAAVCNIVREAEAGGARLWKWMRIEARVGRPLFFANA